jgi:DNA repair photolyase
VIQRAKHPGRFFIDVTKEGCPCGCLYCYVDHIAGNEALLDENELAMLPKQIMAHPDYAPGPHGTLFAFGSHSDLFRTPRLFERLLSALKAVAPLGNPIQISTKQFVRPDWVARLAAARAFRTQIVIFVSCATIRQLALYEPGTASLAKRFASFDSLHTWDIPTCFYIKPCLPGVTDREIFAFVETIRAIRPDIVCVGSLYLNAQIVARLQLSQVPALDEDRKHPLMTNSMGAIDPMPEFVNALQTAFPQNPILKNSACVVAYINGVPCPIHVWERFPQLCVECQDCRSLYQNASVPQEEESTAFLQTALG